MAQFPRAEAKITALAESMIRGFMANSETYPNPVISVTEMETLLGEFKTAQQELSVARTATDEAKKKKDDVLKKLVGAMKPNLRYAEAVTQLSSEKLKLLGWSGPSAPTPLEVPGAASALQAMRVEPGTIELKWQSPPNRAKVAGYEVQKLDLESDIWNTVATSISTSIILYRQEQGQTLKYRIVAFNQAGKALPSNTVAIVA